MRGETAQIHGARGMAVKFFGQFLIEQGEIDAGQLREALALMDSENKQLGEIGVQKGYLCQADADSINILQRTRNRQFGKLAVEMGLLKLPELYEIIAIQRESRLFVGEALVRLESLPADRLPTLLDQFKLDQSPYEPGRRHLVSELEHNPAANLVLDLLPVFCLRLAMMPLKVGEGQPMSELCSYPMGVGVAMSGNPGLIMTLVFDEVFGRRLASRVSGLEASRLSSDLIYDGIGEFLNVVGGNAVAMLEREGIMVELGPPVRDSGLEAGTGFELVIGDGCAALILESI